MNHALATLMDFCSGPPFKVFGDEDIQDALCVWLVKMCQSGAHAEA